MKLIYSVTLAVLCICSGVYCAEECENVEELSGYIFHAVRPKRYVSEYTWYKKCWNIAVSDANYIELHLIRKHFEVKECHRGYILIKVSGTEEVHDFCPQDITWKGVRATSNVTIEYYLQKNSLSSFEILYKIESLICESKDPFRCSDHICISNDQTCDGVKDCEDGRDEIGCGSRYCNLENHFQCSENNCIHETQVCNGEEDCENGADEVGCGFELPIKGVRISLESAISWLKEKRSSTTGWGSNTPGVVTALYLSGGANFSGGDLEEELITKQLELQAAIALLRNYSSILTVNELSMFINALTVSCYSPRKFYGNDLVKILEERVQTAKSSTPGAYLTLCNANWEFSESHIKRALDNLNLYAGYPFERDIQAITVMALSCIKNKTNLFNKVPHAIEMYNTTIKNFIASQQPNGSFGNADTTALVAQALFSCDQEYTKDWNVTATVKFLMRVLNSSFDFSTTTLALPVLNGKSLVDIGYRNCNTQRNHIAGEINAITNKVAGKVQVKYSIFIGDDKDMIHTVFLSLSESSSAFDLMRIAEIRDANYKFLHTDVSGHIYVYNIAGIANDPESGKFWLLYIGHVDSDASVIHRNISPDKLMLSSNDHLIMWYKTATAE